MGVSAEHALSLTERNQYALYVALGEHKGGQFDYETMRWREPIPPQPVLALIAEPPT
jgi:hypothetical protein